MARVIGNRHVFILAHTEKIGLSFALVIVTVLVMIGVLWWAFARIQTTTAQSSHAQDIYGYTLEMEGGVQRENSQMRGFLITLDEAYLKQYRESRANEIEAAAKLDALLADDPKARAQVAQSHERMQEWRRDVGDPLIERSRADREGAQAWLRQNSERVRVTSVLQALRDVRAQTVEQLSIVRGAQDRRGDRAVESDRRWLDDDRRRGGDGDAAGAGAGAADRPVDRDHG